MSVSMPTFEIIFACRKFLPALRTAYPEKLGGATNSGKAPSAWASRPPRCSQKPVQSVRKPLGPKLKQVIGRLAHNAGFIPRPQHGYLMVLDLQASAECIRVRIEFKQFKGKESLCIVLPHVSAAQQA